MEKPIEQYAVVEMMGHRKVIGKVTESEIGTGSLLKVTVLGKDGDPDRTEYIGIASIYCLTIVTEETARQAAAACSPEPTFAWQVRERPALVAASDYDEGDEDRDEW